VPRQFRRTRLRHRDEAKRSDSRVGQVRSAGLRGPELRRTPHAADPDVGTHPPSVQGRSERLASRARLAMAQGRGVLIAVKPKQPSGRRCAARCRTAPRSGPRPEQSPVHFRQCGWRSRVQHGAGRRALPRANGTSALRSLIAIDCAPPLGTRHGCGGALARCDRGGSTDGTNSLTCRSGVAEVRDARHASNAGLDNSAAGVLLLSARVPLRLL
jgi:hypothetical protein